MIVAGHFFRRRCGYRFLPYRFSAVSHPLPRNNWPHLAFGPRRNYDDVFYDCPSYSTCGVVSAGPGSSPLIECSVADGSFFGPFFLVSRPSLFYLCTFETALSVGAACITLLHWYFRSSCILLWPWAAAFQSSRSCSTMESAALLSASLAPASGLYVVDLILAKLLTAFRI